MNLDELLASLNDAAQPELSALPLLDAGDYLAALPRDGETAAQAPHVYVGCFGLWLLANHAFTSPRVAAMAAAGDDAMSPARFSREVMAGTLMADDVTESYRDFARQYTREQMIYATDYVETLVAPRMLRDMFDVQDLSENAHAIARTINERYRRYAAQQPDWSSIAPVIPTYVLTAAELTEGGWLTAMATCAETLSDPDAPEATRRQALARFWALVDYAPEIASPPVVSALVGAFNAHADSSVLQSVLNALQDMDFATVLAAVLADAVRLRHDGDWLGVLLGLWGGEIRDQDLDEFRRQIAAIDHPAVLDAVTAATEHALAQREPWAIQAELALGR